MNVKNSLEKEMLIRCQKGPLRSRSYVYGKVLWGREIRWGHLVIKCYLTYRSVYEPSVLS